MVLVVFDLWFCSVLSHELAYNPISSETAFILVPRTKRLGTGLTIQAFFFCTEDISKSFFVLESNNVQLLSVHKPRKAAAAYVTAFKMEILVEA